ncbi:hypothetical protein SAMN02745163_02068 [Clostridium cavendishii DSM 21758]|uniref:Uncharacterized protein n=1 Tax=Clostridium cavendishii DSM 21758 TaxID=1121302 RepID=A0A1M6K104_9CLOT|nr:hypothetical protein [Clostridium cavendishii]SHJ52564.1 hypothetical protein SAMN02745163_02068 [Clostridium cavendishii DSM 21758]
MNEFEKEMERIEFRHAMEDINNRMDQVLQSIQMASKIQRNYFNGLIESGFNEEQALQIVIAHGVNIGGSVQSKEE